MVRLRRALGPLIAVWLVCQAGSAAAIWLPAFDDCECPHSDGAVCPMHHGASSRGKACSMRGVDASATVALASLLAPAAPAPAPAIVASMAIDSPTVNADRSTDSRRPVPPDPPPPRA